MDKYEVLENQRRERSGMAPWNPRALESVKAGNVAAVGGGSDRVGALWRGHCTPGQMTEEKKVYREQTELLKAKVLGRARWLKIGLLFIAR